MRSFRFLIKSNPALFLLFFFLISTFPILLLVLFPAELVFALDPSNYLLFHNLAEIFSVIVSISIFGVGWYSFDQTRNRHDLFLSVSFLGIGLIDFMHTLAYEGMPPLITPNSGNKSTQFWIIVRFYGAIVFFISSMIQSNKIGNKNSKYLHLGFVLFFCIFVFTLVTFFPKYFPDTFLDGSGLTKFKIYTEFIIIIILIIAFFLYYLRMRSTNDRSIIYFLTAFIFSILSEMVFAIYTNIYDTFSMLGHIYKIFSFYSIYQGLFVSSIKKPYSILSDSNQKLSEEIEDHKLTESKLQDLIRIREGLIRELYHRINNTLQVIKGLIVLQGSEYKKSHDIDDLINKTENRIQAISFVHQLLYSNMDLSRISAVEYFKKLTSYLLNSLDKEKNSFNIELLIDDIQVIIDTAMPLGLICNEMISQSSQFIVESSNPSSVKIVFTNLNEKYYKFEFCHYINQPLNLDEFSNLENSLGTLIIKKLGELQMKGLVKLDQKEGIHWTIDFPIDIYAERV